jgi:hypothetical protein
VHAEKSERENSKATTDVDNVGGPGHSMPTYAGATAIKIAVLRLPRILAWFKTLRCPAFA